ncbi:MAG: PilN domain-containing protein [Gammaproteobacteria bacterium]|nr:PilN domain-containing protein [Gammaproteobacteria bacterium]
MAKINLLPWREALRKEKQQDFFTMLGFFALIAVGIWGGIHFYHVQLIEHQQLRNKYIVDQTALLDEKIKEIQELEKEKQRLLDRMRAIEQLQGNRPLIVRFFDELITSLPEGVSVKKITQRGQNVTINGEAQSNARVSSFMRNLETSDWLEKPQLDIIQATSAKGLRISSFTLRFKQVIPKLSGEEEDT